MSFLISPRQGEVLAMVANGMKNEDIAKTMGVSLSTVKSHLQHIYERISVQSRTEAVLWALKKGHLAFRGEEAIWKP